MNNSITRNSPVPLYFQVSKLIEKEIKDGTLRPGDKFSTEEALVKKYSVSRSTVRKALDDLKQRGWLVQQVGKGTFIGSYHLSQSKTHLMSLTEEMLEKGIIPGTINSTLDFDHLPKEALKELNITDDNTQGYILTRTRTADSTPFVYIKQYIPKEYTIENKEIDESVYQSIEESNNLRLIESLHVVSAASASKEVSRALEISEGSPVVTFTRTTIDNFGRPVIFEQGFGVPGLYEYRLKVNR